MGSTSLFIGVALLALAAPFELSEPLVRLPRQSVSSLEAAVLLAFACWADAIALSRRGPEWRTPLTLPWLALLAAMAAASFASPVSRTNALHMTGRMGAAFGIYLLTVNGVTTRGRLRAVLVLALAAAVVVSVLAILEYLGVRSVLGWLTAFRPGVTTVGAQVRAGGSLQYPTIASMYLEVVFALGLGLLLMELDGASTARVLATCFALIVVGEGITVTFTRAGLVTMAASLSLVGVMRIVSHGPDRGVLSIAAIAVAIAVLFVSSRSAQSMKLRFTSEGQESWYQAKVDAPADLELPTGRTSTVPVTVTNTGRIVWDSGDASPILLSYHWRPADGDRFVTFEGVRTPFAAAVEPNASVTIAARVRPPRQPGRYRLEWDLVQEGRLWFSTEPGATRTISHATIAGEATDAPVEPLIPAPRVRVRPGRVALWHAAAMLVAVHPLLGIGPDNFRLAYGPYAGIASADPRTHSNNMYLEVLVGGGMLALTAFLWLIGRAAGSIRAALDRGGAAALGVAAAVVAIALHASVDSFLSFAPTYVLFSLTLGCAVACARGAETRLDANRV